MASGEEVGVDQYVLDCLEEKKVMFKSEMYKLVEITSRTVCAHKEKMTKVYKDLMDQMVEEMFGMFAIKLNAAFRDGCAYESASLYVYGDDDTTSSNSDEDSESICSESSDPEESSQQLNAAFRDGCAYESDTTSTNSNEDSDSSCSESLDPEESIQQSNYFLRRLFIEPTNGRVDQCVLDRMEERKGLFTARLYGLVGIMSQSVFARMEKKTKVYKNLLDQIVDHEFGKFVIELNAAFRDGCAYERDNKDEFGDCDFDLSTWISDDDSASSCSQFSDPQESTQPPSDVHQYSLPSSSSATLNEVTISSISDEYPASSCSQSSDPQESTQPASDGHQYSLPSASSATLNEVTISSISDEYPASSCSEYSDPQESIQPPIDAHPYQTLPEEQPGMDNLSSQQEHLQQLSPLLLIEKPVKRMRTDEVVEEEEKVMDNDQNEEQNDELDRAIQSIATYSDLSVVNGQIEVDMSEGGQHVGNVQQLIMADDHHGSEHGEDQLNGHQRESNIEGTNANGIHSQTPFQPPINEHPYQTLPEEQPGMDNLSSHREQHLQQLSPNEYSSLQSSNLNDEELVDGEEMVMDNDQNEEQNNELERAIQSIATCSDFSVVNRQIDVDMREDAQPVDAYDDDASEADHIDEDVGQVGNIEEFEDGQVSDVEDSEKGADQLNEFEHGSNIEGAEDDQLNRNTEVNSDYNANSTQTLDSFETLPQQQSSEEKITLVCNEENTENSSTQSQSLPNNQRIVTDGESVYFITTFSVSPVVVTTLPLESTKTNENVRHSITLFKPSSQQSAGEYKPKRVQLDAVKLIEKPVKRMRTAEVVEEEEKVMDNDQNEEQTEERDLLNQLLNSCQRNSNFMRTKVNVDELMQDVPIGQLVVPHNSLTGKHICEHCGLDFYTRSNLHRHLDLVIYGSP